MMVRLTIDGLVAYTRLGQFFEVNEFTGTEKRNIREAIRKDKPYHGGGGAFAYWKIEADK
jgi:hypothetical protein